MKATISGSCLSFLNLVSLVYKSFGGRQKTDQARGREKQSWMDNMDRFMRKSSHNKSARFA